MYREYICEAIGPTGGCVAAGKRLLAMEGRAKKIYGDPDLQPQEISSASPNLNLHCITELIGDSTTIMTLCW
jgi:hypothetical protein